MEKDGKEKYMTTQAYPTEMDKKMKLLSYFKRYMTEHLVKAGAGVVVEQSDSVSRIPHMHTWFRTTCAVVMHLTNGSVQVSLKTLVGKLVGGVEIGKQRQWVITYCFADGIIREFFFYFKILPEIEESLICDRVRNENLSAFSSYFIPNMS